MSSYRLRYSAIRFGLLASVALIQPAIAQESPFAGDIEAPTASRDLDLAGPVYERLNVNLSAESMASAPTAQSRGATGFNQSVAGQLEGFLPDGISLMVSEAGASFVTVGPRAAAAEPALPSDEIDTEQAAEITEDIDSEQARELEARAAPDAVGTFIVHYPVAFDNVPVSKYSDVVAFVDESSRIGLLRNRNLPTSLNATSPSVTPGEALAIASADAGEWASRAEVDGPSLEVWVDEGGEGLLSYRIEMTDNGPEPNARRYWVAATGDGEVLFWESMIHHQHSGFVSGTVWTEAGTPAGPTSAQPMSQLSVSRSTGGVATTGANGLYAFPAGGGNATMKGNLSGPNSVVDNMAGAEMSRAASGTPSSAVDLIFNTSGVDELAQTTAFYWTNRAFDVASEILDPTDLPNLPTIVNRPGQCNAFWNGSSINFFVAGGGCPNMAYNSVVLHEYGHGVDARKGGILNGGYSEGFGDAMSILGTRMSCVGQDFFGPGTCLRDAADLIMWPFDPGDGVHSQGRRYAGFVWELTQQLKSLYAENTAFEVANDLVMGAAKANPSDIPDAVLLSFIVDDDDNDLTNGTPHFAQLAAAADSRNLPRPADPIRHVRRLGFAWANDPSSASYTPSATYAYNSANMPITATRIGVGQYRMTFSGLGGHGVAGANVQVTAYGPLSNACKVQSWSSGGADFVAAVRCFRPNGALVDDRYTILVTWP